MSEEDERIMEGVAVATEIITRSVSASCTSSIAAALLASGKVTHRHDAVAETSWDHTAAQAIMDAAKEIREARAK